MSSALGALGTPGSSGLLAASPFSGTLSITTAEEKALGLAAANGAASDAAIGFSVPMLTRFFYDPTHSQAVPAGFLDFMGIVEHELSEVMGRVSTIGNGNGAFSPLDLFRYSASGTLQTATGGAGYFSTAGTVTGASYAFNTDPTGDYGDWATSSGADSFGAFAGTGTTLGVSSTDFQVMQALGWTSAGYQTDSQINSAVTAGAAVTAFQGGGAAAAIVADTAANIGAAIDSLALMASHGALTSITLTDNEALNVPTPAVTVTVAQLGNDAAAIKLITDPFVLAVTGVTAANATAAGAQAAAAAGLGISNNENSVALAVTDTAANVMANIGALETLAHNLEIGSITISDNAAMTVTAADYQSNEYAFRALANGSLLTVTGLTAIDFNPLSNGLAFSRGATLKISDSAANVAAQLGWIESWTSSNPIVISLTDSGTPTLAIYGSDWDNNRPVLQDIQGSFKLAVSAAKVSDLSSMTASGLVASLSVSDTAANVSAALDTLESLANNHSLTGITLTDSGTPALTLTAAQQTADAAALALITGSYTVAAPPMTAAAALAAVAANQASSVTVADTAAGIAANLDALQGLLTAGKLLSISTTQNGAAIVLTQAQLTSDAPLLADIQGFYRELITAATASQAPALAVRSNVIGVNVADSAANVSAAFDAIEPYAATRKVGNILLTDPGTPVLTLTAAQLISDQDVFNIINNGNYKVAASNISFAQLSSLLGNGHLGAVSLADSAAIVSANLDMLNGLAAIGDVTGATLTDSGSPNLAVTFNQYSGSDLAFINQIHGSHTLSVSAVPVSEMSSVLSGNNVIAISVADQAAEVSSHLDMLQAGIAAGKVTGIVLTDGGTPTLTVTSAQLVSDAQAISGISSAYSLVVTGGTSISQLTPSLLSHTQSISVSDSAANIAGDLDMLQSLAAAGKLTGVAVTGTGYANLTVTAAQLSNDAAVLKEITGNYVLDITAGTNGGTVTALPGHGSIVTFSGNVSDFTLAGDGVANEVKVTSAGGTETLSGVNAVQIGSQTDIVAQTPLKGGAANSGNLTELYSAVFARLPDVPGLGFYQSYLSSNPNTPLPTFAEYFLSSSEYTSNPAHHYAQTTAGETQFITDSYTNLLGRQPEAGAVPFYLNVINQYTAGLAPGTQAYAQADLLAHAYVLTYFSASSEFLADVSVTAQTPSSAQHWLLLTA